MHTYFVITVTAIDFDPQSSALHVAGRIREETPYAKMGAFHTLDLELHRNFSLEKA